MKPGFLVAAGCLTLFPVALVAAPPRQIAAPAEAPASTSLVEVRAMLDQYCVGCHGQAARAAGAVSAERLTLDDFDLAALSENREVGETMVRKLRAGLMPPQGARHPEAGALDSLIGWMEHELDQSAATHLPAPGLHRMNRGEYSNAIRDLLALEIDAADFLPSDDSSHGFDNMAGTLTMSPALMDAYLSAAGKISRLALGTETAPTLKVFDAPLDTSQIRHVPGLPFGTRGGMLIEHEFPANGEYVFTVKGMTGYFTRVLGNVDGEQLDVSIDGARVYVFDWDDEIADTEGNGARSPAIPITAGFHRVGVTFIATNDLPPTAMNVAFERTANSPGSIAGYQFYPHVGQVFIEGPYNGTKATTTRSREKIFVCRPESGSPEAPCAREIIETLVTGAFRRPATEADIALVMDFYQSGREEGGTFDAGIEAALQRILADPEFIFRAEAEPVGLAEGGTYGLSDLELASRLSFFLWSSAPDDELLGLASEGRLQDAGVLEQQVRRMIADPRAGALIGNFTGQWLNVRGLAASEPVVDLFPDFDSTLREAYAREIELFFASIVDEDRSVLDLLNADYTFVNERLAKQYGIPNVYGSHFRRVSLGDDLDMRRGLLGKGALLTVTSDAARTSPVKRGKWFLETFMGVSPPEPPPGVEINIDQPENTPTTLRAKMEAHRANPVCASCHNIFEPMGLAMENFDAVGTWRTLDAGVPIDPTGVISDGTRLEGVQSLREVLMRKSDLFAEVVIEKLLTYALGRGVEYEDMPMVRTIARQAAEDNYRFSSILLGIVGSDAFRMNMTAVTGEEIVPQQANR